MGNRTTPEHIRNLKPNQIFVFGSNKAGRHGKGAAKTALGWGAKFGQASGIQGRTYGIPTKNASITKTLKLEEIQRYVTEFINYAKQHPDKTFLVTEIGCGLAKLKVKDVALIGFKLPVVTTSIPITSWLVVLLLTSVVLVCVTVHDEYSISAATWLPITSTSSM